MQRSSTIIEDIRGSLESARDHLLALRKVDGSWNFCAHLGQHFISQYYLVSRWLGLNNSQIDPQYLENLLRRSQLPDGSWAQLSDPSLGVGELNATIFNYWALKAMGIKRDDSVLEKSRSFILQKGGLSESALFTKIFLALFGNFSWHDIPKVPYFAFVEHLPCNYQCFSQWVIPHLFPIAYLRRTRACRKLGEEFLLTELSTSGRPALAPEEISPQRLYDWPLVRKILNLQQPKGSWGGYTVSSLLVMMMLSHCKEKFAFARIEIERAAGRAQSFIEWLYFDPSAEGCYQGALMDGHFWDTLLVANGLVEAGTPLKALETSRDYLLSSQQKSGGFPYGVDFEYAPDVDDTAEAVLLLKNWPEERGAMRAASDWLRSRQNSDGGWGAFNQNNNGNFLIRYFSQPFSDSVDLFDESSADCTGHVLDALSKSGATRDNDPAIERAVDYLRRTQNGKIPAWEGRWAVNFLFGTTTALVGMLKVGVSEKEDFIQRAFSWLLACQNLDGGFGESTLSYRDIYSAGRGHSTPSQTAWVLWALSHCQLAKDEAAKRAANYLLSEQKNGTWVDGSITGTGHPGLLYMNYPSYAKVFPMIALGAYAAAISPAESP